MPEWLIERGIGETRLALVDRGEILEAWIILDGAVAAGAVLDGKLSRAAPAIAVAGGQEHLLPEGAPGVTEGAPVRIEVTRERLGAEPWKRPLARVTTKDSGPAPFPEGREVAFPGPRDELAEAGWDELVEEARSGHVHFPGGRLHIALTPAMTLIDVDGSLAPADLMVEGAKAAARAIRRHGVGGSIGIDLPTVPGRDVRRLAAEAVDAHLPKPFERTAVNGFGFLQVVRPRSRASLFELAAQGPEFEARALLRRAARLSGPVCLTAHPAVIACLEARPEWLAGLGRQTGGPVRLSADGGMPIYAGHAQR